MSAVDKGPDFVGADARPVSDRGTAASTSARKFPMVRHGRRRAKRKRGTAMDYE